MANGRLSDMIAFHAHGWELVVADLPEAGVPPVGPRTRKVVRIGDGRYEFELPLDPPPDRIMAELTAAGANVVSLNPVRETLEDFFIQQVTNPEAVRTRRGLEDVP